jgi:signal peptidase I
MNPSAQAVGNAHALQCELAGEVLRSSGSLHLRVMGWSMAPTVWPGDTLVIEPAGTDQISAGDIVLFSGARRFVAHRVVAIADNSGTSSVRTQGDAVPYPDSPLAASDVMGKVSFILRMGRKGECIEPGRRMHFSKRAVAAVFRHSSFAARMVVGVRGRLQKLHGPSSDATSRFFRPHRFQPRRFRPDSI